MPGVSSVTVVPDIVATDVFVLVYVIETPEGSGEGYENDAGTSV